MRLIEEEDELRPVRIANLALLLLYPLAWQAPLARAGLLSARMPSNFSMPLPPSDPDLLGAMLIMIRNAYGVLSVVANAVTGRIRITPPQRLGSGDGARDSGTGCTARAAGGGAVGCGRVHL